MTPPTSSPRDRARAARLQPTPAERRAWAVLRRASPRWRRQAVVLGAVVPFWCPAARLALIITDGRPLEPNTEAVLIRRGAHIYRLTAAAICGPAGPDLLALLLDRAATAKTREVGGR